MEAAVQTNLTKGGEFLVRSFEPFECFTPEEFTQDELAMADGCRQFVDAHVMNRLEEIDSMADPSLMPTLLTEAGANGLLGISVPDEFGGLGLDFTSAMLTTEVLGSAHSFSVAVLAHTGIGTLPILYFGSKEQKAKYLPKLASGEWKAAYCLTEPGSGSDALGAKSKAVLSADGKHYLLNGRKMWITNGGFADVFVVFAKIDGEHFTGFIVEKAFGGISMDPEEKKMGIKGSSTRRIYFEDVKVPVENVLGEIGKGHRIAFNILNIGRLKLSAATLGSAKRVITVASKYAQEREQFGKAIAQFGAIQHKLAEMAIRVYANESATYRATGDIDRMEKELQRQGQTYETSLLAAAQEFAAECAIMKVHGSEMLDYVVDEGVQVFGGYGFSAEYPMDRAYRDSRINRIYEGTNEINRMLTVDYLLRKAMKGELPLLQAAMDVQKELTSVPEFSNTDGQPFQAERKAIDGFKKASLMVAGAAAQKYAMGLADEQEVLMFIADMLTETYVSESTLLRTERLAGVRGEQGTSLAMDMMRVYLNDAADRISAAGKNAINAMAEGDMNRMMHMGLKRFTKYEGVNTVQARRRIAASVLERNAYTV